MPCHELDYLKLLINFLLYFEWIIDPPFVPLTAKIGQFAQYLKYPKINYALKEEATPHQNHYSSVDQPPENYHLLNSRRV